MKHLASSVALPRSTIDVAIEVQFEVQFEARAEVQLVAQFEAQFEARVEVQMPILLCRGLKSDPASLDRLRFAHSIWSIHQAVLPGERFLLPAAHAVEELIHVVEPSIDRVVVVRRSAVIQADESTGRFANQLRRQQAEK